MHTTIGYAKTPVDPPIEEFVTGVADQHVRVVGDDIYIGEYNRIVAMMAVGHSLRYARLVSPSLRRFFSPYIEPNVSLAGDSMDAWQPMDLSRNPIPLATNEALNAKSLQIEVHPTFANIVGVNLAKAALAPVSGEIHTMRIIDTSPTEITEKVWTNHQLTLGVDLPVGRYQIVGAECASSKGGLFRFVPVGEDYRPGGIMHDAVKTKQLHSQRLGNWGVWCEFDQLTPPTLDLLPYATTDYYSLKLDLVKVR